MKVSHRFFRMVVKSFPTHKVRAMAGSWKGPGASQLLMVPSLQQLLNRFVRAGCKRGAMFEYRIWDLVYWARGRVWVSTCFNALSSSNTCEAKPQNLLVHSFRAFWASPWMWYWDIAFLSQEKYNEYTLEERAKIGRYGAENGPGKSTRQVLDTKRLPWGLLCGGYIISLRSHHQKSKHTSF